MIELGPDSWRILRELEQETGLDPEALVSAAVRLLGMHHALAKRGAMVAPFRITPNAPMDA